MAPINNEDLLALQSYVTAADATQYDSLPADTVILDLSHSNLKQRHVEIRFSRHDTVDDLRSTIHRKTGTPPSMQHLSFYIHSSGPTGGWDQSSSTSFPAPSVEIPPGTESSRKLGYYSLPHGSTVFCRDLDPNSDSANGAYEDVTLVDKYVMSDEDYDRRSGTLRDWAREKRRKDSGFSWRKHAREHAEWVEARRQAKWGLELPKGFELDERGNVVRCEVEEEKGLVPGEVEEEGEGEYGMGSVEGITVGLRCEVRPGGRRGCVSYVGTVPELPREGKDKNGGMWVGVTFDEPVGKTDGSVATKQGRKRYFDAGGPNRGGFVRGKNVQVGDFPERDLMDELSDSSEDEL